MQGKNTTKGLNKLMSKIPNVIFIKITKITKIAILCKIQFRNQIQQ